MLDTGIDIPEVVNLVFFKLVRSKTKFWQMVGRGTRLRPGLFGLGKDKEFFYIFDYCQNLEYFKANPEATDGSLGMSLGKLLFVRRLELIAELDKIPGGEKELRRDTAGLLRQEVAAMNPNNFIVRPKRRLVERYTDPEAWEPLGLEQQAELASDVAGLPSSLVDTDQDAKQFDLVMLQLQLAVLRSDAWFAKLRRQVEAIAGLLSEKDSIPMVRAQMPLIQELQTDEFWQDVTPAILENVRKRLRSLLKLIEKSSRKPVYTDFQDEIGEATEIELDVFTAGANFNQFRLKARFFLKEHEANPVISKLRMNRPLTLADLAELEQMLIRAGIGTAEDLSHAKEISEGLGLFLRSLIGLDRAAAKEAFAKFLDSKSPTANQIEFINVIIDHLTDQGYMDPGLLYASPFIDFSPKGVDGLFSADQVTAIFSILDGIRETAATAIA